MRVAYITLDCDRMKGTLGSMTNIKIPKPLVANGADPWVVRYKHHYYYCRTDAHERYISVSRANKISGIGKARLVPVWQPLKKKELYASSHGLWAPELHHIQGKWYIYFTADDGDSAHHRMYVLENETDNPQGNYIFKGKLATHDDHWAIDGTVLQYQGKLYFVWSGWEGDDKVSSNLYIAQMSNPWTIVGERICISRPEFDWEKHGGGLYAGVNEGPEVLRHKGETFVIFSASAANDDNYCLGQLKLTGNDPMDPEAWLKKPKPVFKRSDRLFGPGHASFVKSIDGKQDWIIYHTEKYSHAGWKREVRGKKFSWNKDGSPHFGKPE